MPCPCSKGASILPPHVPCHCPFTCHICPCPYTSRRASPLPSYTHMCPALAPTRDLPQCLDLALTPTLPLPHMCPALLRFVPRPCPHMCPVFVSTRAPPLHHTCSTLAPLYVPQLPPHVLCPSALASTRVLPLPPHVPCTRPIRASPLPARHTCPDLFPHMCLAFAIHMLRPCPHVPCPSPTRASPLPTRHTCPSPTCASILPPTTQALPLPPNLPTCPTLALISYVICLVSSLLFPQ